MTGTETYQCYELLKGRLGWETSEVGPAVAVELSASESGRFYQDEHAIITLENIQAVTGTTSGDINPFLIKFPRQAIFQMLADVDPTLQKVQENVAAFDNAISLRTAINVIETIITSVRSNHTQRITKEAADRLFVDVNGGMGNPNFPGYVGLRQRYVKEIEKLRDMFNTVRSLEVYTLGGQADEKKYLL